MGFDNDCIVNIQSLAGEYFCPVCRLLVYPNEALQSQCTHLYCKLCLTYIVSTTMACPYDGYLVTEADSKPLTESNKTLAETIGEIAVHCLYNRSGCTWQGSLSECTSHCSGCAFGNSPVVCNRCGIQIVHRQVQEHAQNCPGVQGQVQQAESTHHSSTNSAATSTVQSQTSTLVAAGTTQALTSQTVAATTTTGQDLNQLAAPTSQTQPLAQTVLQPAAEQWYQQYYQQYPGHGPYQQQYQHYYPYQQSVVPQYQQHVQSYGHPRAQSQSQGQPQPQPQSQPQSQGQSQSISHIQASVATQSQNPMQVNQRQQFQTAVQPHSQIQSLGSPPANGQALPQPQPYPQAQPHPVSSQPQQQHQVQQPVQYHYPQMQHSRPQVKQTIQKYPVSQPQVQPQLQPHAPVQHLSQPQMHPHQPIHPKIHPHHHSQPLTAIIQPQVQSSSSHAVTGHHPYPQPQPHQNIQLGAPQPHMPMHSQVGPQPQSPHPVQMQNHFPQQTPMVRPHQSHAMFPNQQQLALLASTVQGQSITTLQQQSANAYSQQPGQINQRPIMQPVQQPLPQQPIVQQQMPMTSHLRPQGPAHSFAEHTHAYPHSQANATLSHNTQHTQSQNAVGMPFVPNHAVPSQPLTQSASAIPVRRAHTGASHLSVNQNMMVGTSNQVQLSSELQSRASESVERLGDVSKQNTDSAFGKLDKSVKDLDTMSETAIEITSAKSETDVKPIEVGNKQNGEDPESAQTSGTKVNALENGDSVNKNFMKEEAAESAWQPLSGDKSGSTVFGVRNDTVDERSFVKDKDIQDRTLMKNSSSLEKELPESQSGKLQVDDTCDPQPPTSSDNASPAVSQPLGSQGLSVDEYRGIVPSDLGQSGGFPQPSHPAPSTDQGKNQLINYGPAAVQQRPSEMSASQLPPPGVSNQPLSARHPSTLLRNHGPGPAHSGQPLNSTDNFLPPMLMQSQGSDIQLGGMLGPAFSTSYGGEPTHCSTPGQSFQPQSLGPPVPYNQGHLSPSHAVSSNFSHVGAPQFGTLPPRDLHGRAPANLPMHAPAGPEGLRGQQRPTNMKVGETYPHQRPGYLNGPQGSGLHYERFKSFPVPSQQNIYQREFEDDLKKFPRPSSKFRDYSLGPCDKGPHGFSFDSGAKLNPGDGERLVGFHDNAREKSGSTHHPDFIGLGPGYARHHVDGLTPRNPIGEYAEMSSWRLEALSGGLVSKLGTDAFDGRDPRCIGDSVGSAFHDSQFPLLPSHVRMGEHARSGDCSGQDSFTGRFQGDEHVGPHNFPRHLQLGDPPGFGAPGGHIRTVKLGGHQNLESFSRGNRPDHSWFGELGFRSSFSFPVFPNDGGYFTGNIGSFDNSRKRKAASRGWCRICKVDCETVEGLDLHSQTREHQKMAMDMVKSIKQNAKKQKIQ